MVGRGIGSKKNLPLMRKLAEALGAELGCTRPVVEAGWLEYRHQIGQTGVSVSPKLLVSIGVSGAIQHLAGIGGAECIIAVNEDPDAPIYGAAQYKVVGDAVEVVEELLAQLEREAPASQLRSSSFRRSQVACVAGSVKGRVIPKGASSRR